MAKIALITRDEALAVIISDFLQKEDHVVSTLTEYDAYVAIKKPDGTDVIIMDIQTVTGPDTYDPISSPPLIILCDLQNSSTVKKIIRNGAWDCIAKPIRPAGSFIPLSVDRVKERLLNSISTATEFNRQEYAIKIEDLKNLGIIGESHAIKSSMAKLIPAIKSDLSILIKGESGTGKELFARAVHKKSLKRCGKPFIAVNCATITETLADGILLGWEKGIHATAYKQRDGLLIEANEGTLFLDEIGDLSIENQTRLLTAIQEKQVTRLGGTEPKDADFRVVAATNKDIHKMIKKGKFREDLYFRISDFEITIPPLRKRKEDIKDIVDHYIQILCKKHQLTPVREYTEDFIEALKIWNWPGNIRELMSEIRSAVFKADNVSKINAHYLSTDLRVSWMVHSMSEDCDHLLETLDDLNMGAGDPYEDEPDFSHMHGERDDQALIEDVFSDGLGESLNFTPNNIPTLAGFMKKHEEQYFRTLQIMIDKEQLAGIAAASKAAGIGESTFKDKKKKHGLIKLSLKNKTKS